MCFYKSAEKRPSAFGGFYNTLKKKKFNFFFKDIVTEYDTVYCKKMLRTVGINFIFYLKKGFCNQKK